MEEKYNNPYLLTYRADLHQSLLNRCREVGAEVFANSFVQSVNADNPSVKLVDGRTLNADILVGADGIFHTFFPLLYFDLWLTRCR